MVSNITYKLSAFSDYSLITYSKENIINVLDELDDITFVPVMIPEILPNGMECQRMQFLAQNKRVVVTILSDRADIQITSDRKEGFHNDEIKAVKSNLLEYMGKIIKVFSDKVSLPYRLAWFTSYVYFEQTLDEINLYRDRFLKRITFFDENRLDDTMVRYGARRDVSIGKENERLNVLMTINRYKANIGASNIIDGYKIDYDINTWQEKRKGRFAYNDVKEFIEWAIKYQGELDEEILP